MSPLTGPAVVREVVGQKLSALDGCVVADVEGDFVVSRASTSARVKVVGLEPDVTAVLVFAVVAVGVERLDEACRFLAVESLELPLAHFELHQGLGVIVASHTLLGEFVSAEELRAAIAGVTDAAAAYGPLVRERFGAAAAQGPTPPTVDTHEPLRPAMDRSGILTGQPRRRAVALPPAGIAALLLLAGCATVALGVLSSWWASLMLVAVIGALLLVVLGRRRRSRTRGGPS